MRLGLHLGLGVLLLALVIGVLLGLGTYTFVYAEGASYLSNDPESCVNCHIMRPQYDSWLKGSHHTVATCNDCHVDHDSFAAKWFSKGRNGWNHSWAFTFQNFDEPIQIKGFNVEILHDNCLHCHSDFMHDVIAGVGDADTDGLDCIRCHASVGHGPLR